MTAPDDGWHVLPLPDLLRALRELAGLSDRDAARLLAPGNPNPARSVATSAERRGAGVRVGTLLERARAYGLGEVQIRVWVGGEEKSPPTPHLPLDGRASVAYSLPHEDDDDGG